VADRTRYARSQREPAAAKKSSRKPGRKKAGRSWGFSCDPDQKNASTRACVRSTPTAPSSASASSRLHRVCLVGVDGEDLDRDHFQRPSMRRAQDDGRGAAGSVSLKPAFCAHAPPITRGESREAPIRPWRREVVAREQAELEELARCDRADRVAANVLGPGRAATVSIKAGQRISRTRDQRAANHVQIRLTTHNAAV